MQTNNDKVREELKKRAVTEFRHLWVNINNDNKHLTTEKIEDLICRIIDFSLSSTLKEVKMNIEKEKIQVFEVDDQAFNEGLSKAQDILSTISPTKEKA